MNRLIRQQLFHGLLLSGIALLGSACESASAATPDTDPIYAVVSPTKIPFQQDVSVTVDAGTLSNTTSFAVPAGMRLVIEYVSGSVRVADEELVRVNLVTTVQGATVQHTLTPSAMHRDFDNASTIDDYVVAYGQSLHLYADSESSVTLVATRSENMESSPTYFAMSISGYFVGCGTTADCPVP